ncbi:Transport inhibitor response 1-like protein [Actinidia chinensis var. chinensis]|uniref:Transport inhibitor response 1-like protein n=1 Tax=Actinidia chinensis var. chinensis TaxID=1590841 RepID=A0A2R6QNZ7_ACTCC|nr:Transport inhibitor response 1-like protein [Actinidia chinensis var. chinensis]
MANVEKNICKNLRDPLKCGDALLPIVQCRGVKRALSARYGTGTARKNSAWARFGHGISWARHGTARSEQARARAWGTKMTDKSSCPKVIGAKVTRVELDLYWCLLSGHFFNPKTSLSSSTPPPTSPSLGAHPIGVLHRQLLYGGAPPRDGVVPPRHGGDDQRKAEVCRLQPEAPWVTSMAQCYRALEKLCLKCMLVTEEDLELLASFPSFKELVLICCDGFGTSGLVIVANKCRSVGVMIVCKLQPVPVPVPIAAVDNWVPQPSGFISNFILF